MFERHVPFGFVFSGIVAMCLPLGPKHFVCFPPDSVWHPFLLQAFFNFLLLQSFGYLSFLSLQMPGASGGTRVLFGSHGRCAE